MRTVNIYHESNKLRTEIMSGQVPKGSIVHLQWPSGAEEAVRFHGVSSDQNYRHRSFMVGCNMGWDNGATEWYDLSIAFIQEIEYPKGNDKRWDK